MGPLNAMIEFNARLKYSDNSCIQVRSRTLGDASLLQKSGKNCTKCSSIDLDCRT